MNSSFGHKFDCSNLYFIVAYWLDLPYDFLSMLEGSPRFRFFFFFFEILFCYFFFHYYLDNLILFNYHIDNCFSPCEVMMQKNIEGGWLLLLKLHKLLRKWVSKRLYWNVTHC